jgi:hypothetical protein
LLLVALVPIVAVTALAVGKGKEEIYSYLSCVRCATCPTGKTGDGTIMKTKAEKHTVACMKVPECAASGYGLEINEGTAMEKNYVFYKFDKKSSDMAAMILKKTKKKDHVSVAVKGVKGMDMIKVISMKEITMK